MAFRLGLIAQERGPTVGLAGHAMETFAQQVVAVLGARDFDIASAMRNIWPARFLILRTPFQSTLPLAEMLPATVPSYAGIATTGTRANRCAVPARSSCDVRWSDRLGCPDRATCFCGLPAHKQTHTTKAWSPRAGGENAWALLALSAAGHALLLEKAREAVAAFQAPAARQRDDPEPGAPVLPHSSRSESGSSRSVHIQSAILLQGDLYE